MVETSEASVSEESRDDSRLHVGRIVFAITSVAFLAYLAFGTIEARIWRFGRLYFEDRDITHVWAYFGDRLPEMPGQGLIEALYWIGLAVTIVGTVLGLWLFLGTDDEDPTQERRHESAEHHG